MPLVEEIGSSPLITPSGNMNNNADLPPEVSEAMAEMEGWRNSNPAAFEAVMKATMESKAAGDDEETSLKKIEAALKIQQQSEMETLMAAQQAAQVATEGIELPGSKGKVGLDGQVKQTNIASLDITPKPSFVVKTIGTHKDGKQFKTFLNICSHDALTKPHMKKKLNEEGEEVEGWNIPLAIGPLRNCIDNKGETSIVHDCIVNPDVISGVADDDTGGEKDFLIQLALQYVEQKYHCELDRRYKLPKLKYKSSNIDNPKEIASQRIKDASKQPSISEVSSSKTKTPSKTTSSSSKNKNNKNNNQQTSKNMEAKRLKSSLWLLHVDGSEIEDKTRATSINPVKTVEPEKEPIVRMNRRTNQQDEKEGEDIDSLPRSILIKIGPLGKYAFDALTNNEAKNDNEETNNDNDDVMIDVSCYDLKVKLPGHLDLHIVFPYAIVPEEVSSILKPYELCNDDHDIINHGVGGNEDKRMPCLHVQMPIDPTPYDILSNDPGSRPWLLAQALHGGGDGRNETELKQLNEKEEKEKLDKIKYNSIEEAENRFHLRASGTSSSGSNKTNSKSSGSSTYDPISGLISREEDPVDDNEELPEDRFHKEDALSNHYISQREGDKNEKWKKHEKEKKEREERKLSGDPTGIDENVEYIDVEDFSPGGKYGPPAIDIGSRRDELTGVKYTTTDDMAKAANVVVAASKASSSSASSSTELIQEQHEYQGEGTTTSPKHALSPKRIAELKSTIWADLLD